MASYYGYTRTPNEPKFFIIFYTQKDNYKCFLSCVWAPSQWPRVTSMPRVTRLSATAQASFLKKVSKFFLQIELY